MNKLEPYSFHKIYELADLIDNSVRYEEDFWNFGEDYFVTAATRFSKETLLHQYIVTRAFNYYRRKFRKDGDLMGKEDLEDWYGLFNTYSIEISRTTIDFDDFEAPSQWFENNSFQFEQLFNKMADEAFHLLFLNRQFLLAFNRLASETIRTIAIPQSFLTGKGTIRRAAIPQWVKTAVFHRDKGRCVFCNTDLTGLVNTLTGLNYDHIVPLDLFGPNDPCNIQLTCEKCNKSKTNKEGSTSNRYMPWWPK